MKHKKVLSVLLAALMIITVFSSAFEAVAVDVKTSDKTPGDVTFIVPEAIYLEPKVNSWTSATTAGFQYYVNNTSANATKNTLDKTGNIYFTYANCSSATLSYQFYNNSLTGTLSGSATVPSSITSGGSVNITGGTSPSLDAGTTGCYIMWKATYTDSSDGKSKTAVAFSYVYKPYTIPVAGFCRTKDTDGWGDKYHGYAQSIGWISGFHSVSGSGNYYARYSTSNNAKGFAPFLSADTGTMAMRATTVNTSQRYLWQLTGTPMKNAFYSTTASSSYFYAAADGDNVSSDAWFNSSNSGTYNIATATYSNKESDDTNKITVANVAAKGVIYIDTSRYTNLNQVPNLGIGLMVTDHDQADGETAYWRVADMTGVTNNFTGSYYSGSDNVSNVATNCNTPYIAGCGTSRDNSNNGNDHSGVYYAGTWPCSITSSSTQNYVAKTYYCNENDDEFQANAQILTLQATQYDKTALRTAVANATKLMAKLGVSGANTSGNLTSVYFDGTSGYMWNDFCAAYKAAVIGLTKLDASCDVSSLVSNLKNAIDAICTSVKFNSKGGTSVSDVFVDIGNSSYGVASSISYTPSASPTRTGYTLQGWSKSDDNTKDTYPITLGYNNTIYACWKANTYTVTLDNQGAWSAGTTSATATYDSAMPSITVPRKDGYTFGGYFTGTGGSGTQYYKADGTSNRTWNLTSNTTLYAKWTPITYTVAYNGNGATGGSTASQNATYDGAAFALSTNGFEKKHVVTFNYSLDPAGTVESGDTTVKVGTETITGTTTGTATATFNGWEETAGFSYRGQNISLDTYSPAWYANKRTDVMGHASYGNGAYDKVAMFSHAYTFNQVFNGTESTPLTGTGTDNLYPDGALVRNMLTANGTVTLKANWTLGSVTLPTPVKSDAYGISYRFLGWYDAATGGNKIGDGGATYTPQSSAVTLYARFEPIYFTVRFINEGTVAATRNVMLGRTAPLPPAPTKAADDTYHYGADQNGTGTWGSGNVNITESKDIFATYPDQSAHNFVTVTNAPDCTHTGTATKTCTVCGHVVVENLPANGHTEVEIPAVPATCNNPGKSAGVKCSVCNVVLTQPTDIPALGHEFRNYEYLGDATCFADGHERAKCIRCDATDTRVKAGTQLEHSFTDYRYNDDAGCSTPGTMTAYCDHGCRTTDTKTDPSHPAAGHNWIVDENNEIMWFDNNDATCTFAGQEFCYCLRCRDIQYRNKAETPEGHTEVVRRLSANAVKATCTTAGSHYEEVYCSKCKQIITEAYRVTDPALNHKNAIHHDEKAKTCTMNGNPEYWYCPDCYKYFSDENCANEMTGGSWIIPKSHGVIDHVAAHDSDDCSDIGNIEYWKCRDCGKYYTDSALTNEVTEAQTKRAAHHLNVETVAARPATCTADGIIACNHCLACGFYTTDDWATTLGEEDVTIPALDHDFATYTYNNDATCTADGTETAACTRCTATDTRTAVGTKKAHVFASYTSDGNATCTADGTKTAFCEYGCGTSNTLPDVGSKLPHSFTNYIYDEGSHRCFQNGTETAVCDMCHTAISTREKAGTAAHTALTHVEAVIAATCAQEGVNEHWYCGGCGKYYSDAAATNEISYEDTRVAKMHLNLVRVAPTEPTCTDDGNIEYWYCDVCDRYFSDAAAANAIIEAETVIAARHPAASIVKHDAYVPASCTENGTITYWECTACGKFFSDASATAEIASDAIYTVPEHRNLVFHAAAAPSDCMHTGTYAYWECLACGKLFNEDKSAEIGENDIVTGYGDHRFVHFDRTEPNCLYDGLQEHWMCAVCGAYATDAAGEHLVTYDDLVIPSTGDHHFEWVNISGSTCTETGTQLGTCTGCGLEKTVTVAPTGHSYGGWYMVTDSDCEHAGVKERECTKCGYKQQKDVAKLPHIDEDNDGICDCCRTILTYVPIESDDYIETSNFRCSKCDWYDQNKDVPFTGFFVKIIHFIYHFIQYYFRRH